MAVSIQHTTVQKEDENVTIDVMIQDTSAGNTGKTGLLYNTSNLTAYYVRNGSTPVSIGLQTLAAVNSAWGAGGFKELDSANMPGLYRFDVPNEIFDAGVDRVAIYFNGASDMDPSVVYIDLVSYDPNAADLGVSAPVADAVWDELTVDHVGAGSFGLALGTTLAPPTAAQIATALQAQLAPVFGLAQAGGGSTIQLAASASAVDSFYSSPTYVVLIVHGTGAGQAAAIASYVGATRTATINGAWTVNPDSTSRYLLLKC